MSDNSGKAASSSLAITEKRPQRSGGCVGIFFQLFDWNRRLAKKKLFSKKLLPPARAKRASKKFGRDEKLPMAKLLLIADENRGGFPNMKNSDCSSADSERTHEMRSPSLVARLMGLESMPAARRGKPEKASGSEFCRGREKKASGCNNHVIRTSCDQLDFIVERGQGKVESRPQKLQKTGLFERRPVTRFGAEAMQLKSMLSRSRKHHPKLSSPVKSPRMGRNTTRLMEAATKILEPGLQATNRAKCSLTYGPSSRHISLGDEVMREGPVVLTANQSKQPSSCVENVKSLKIQSSCRSCSNWFDVLDSRSNVEEKLEEFASSAAALGVSLSNRTEKSKTKPPMLSLEQEKNLTLRNQERNLSYCNGAMVDMGMRSSKDADQKPQFREDSNQYSRPSQRIKSQRDVVATSGAKNTTQKQDQALLVKGRGISRPRSTNLQNEGDPSAVASVNGKKNGIGQNRNMASFTRPRTPSKQLDKGKADMENNLWNGRGDSSSRPRLPTRKKRPVGNKPHVESTGLSNSTLRKQKGAGCSEDFGKIAGLNSSPTNKTPVKTELLDQDDAKGSRKGVDVISFTFNSPMRHTTECTTPKKILEKTVDQHECRATRTFLNRRLASDANSGIPSTQMGTQLRGKALGALLEEKLRELTLERDGFGIDNGPPGKSTASILEELIYALTAERPFSHEYRENCTMETSQELNSGQDPSSDSSLHFEKFNTNRKLQAAAKAQGAGAGFSLAGESEQPSPGSVLDACFSNDSCFSESLDGYSGCKLHPESMECSYDQLELSELDVDLSDSANSLNTGMAESDNTKNSLSNAYSVLCGVDTADIALMGNELTQAWEVLVNAGLLLGNNAHNDDMLLEDFPIIPLLNKLETNFYTGMMSPKCSVDFMEAKDNSQCRRFLFDCVIEFLNMKYGDVHDCRYKGWARLPFLMNSEFLTREVFEEVRRWVAFAGKAPDEIIEREMSHDLVKWTGFGMESLETGDEIELDLLQVLIDELVMDLGRYTTCT